MKGAVRVLEIFCFSFFLTISVGLDSVKGSVGDRELREEVKVLKEDVRKMKEDIFEIKADIREIKATLIQMEKRFTERLEQMEKRFAERFKQMEKRFEQLERRIDSLERIMLAIFGGIVVIVVAVIGFAYWDRRTIIRRSVEESKVELEREWRVKDIIAVLREKAKTDKELAQIIRRFGLL